MSDRDDWQGHQPALGVAIVRLLSLRARMLRVEAALRLDRATKIAKLLSR